MTERASNAIDDDDDDDVDDDDDSDGTPNKALRRAWPSPNGFLNKGLFKVKAKSPCAECPV